MSIKIVGQPSKATNASPVSPDSPCAGTPAPAELKIFLVRCNARFMTPTEIVKRVKEELGLDISPQRASMYNPTMHAGRKLSQKYVKLFHAERRAFIENLEDLPMSHRANRLRLLDELAHNAKRDSDRLSAIDLSRKEMAELDWVPPDEGH